LWRKAGGLEVRIPQTHPAVQTLLRLVPEEFHPHTWIAGSAACRYPEAWDAGGDLDAWICAPLDADRRNRTWGRAHAAITDLGHLPDTPADEDYAGMSELLYAHDRIHILLTSCSIEEVLKHFDISCHAMASSLDSETLMAAQGYRPEVRILGWKDPARTLTRGCKFALRYNDHTFWHDPATRDLAAMVFQLPDLAVEPGL
jgi:hypothetical protein